MPCHSIQISNIDLGAVLPAVLRDAVRGLGFDGDITQGAVSGRLALGGGVLAGVSLSFRSGVLSVRGRVDVDQATAAVKRAYSKTLVTQHAKRYGWRVKPGLNGKILLQKG